MYIKPIILTPYEEPEITDARRQAEIQTWNAQRTRIFKIWKKMAGIEVIKLSDFGDEEKLIKRTGLDKEIYKTFKLTEENLERGKSGNKILRAMGWKNKNIKKVKSVFNKQGDLKELLFALNKTPKWKTNADIWEFMAYEIVKRARRIEIVLQKDEDINRYWNNESSGKKYIEEMKIRVIQQDGREYIANDGFFEITKRLVVKRLIERGRQPYGEVNIGEERRLYYKFDFENYTIPLMFTREVDNYMTNFYNELTFKLNEEENTYDGDYYTRIGIVDKDIVVAFEAYVKDKDPDLWFITIGRWFKVEEIKKIKMERFLFIMSTFQKFIPKMKDKSFWEEIWDEIKSAIFFLINIISDIVNLIMDSPLIKEIFLPIFEDILSAFGISKDFADKLFKAGLMLVITAPIGGMLSGEGLVAGLTSIGTTEIIETIATTVYEYNIDKKIKKIKKIKENENVEEYKKEIRVRQNSKEIKMSIKKIEFKPREMNKYILEQKEEEENWT